MLLVFRHPNVFVIAHASSPLALAHLSHSGPVLSLARLDGHVFRTITYLGLSDVLRSLALAALPNHCAFGIQT